MKHHITTKPLFLSLFALLTVCSCNTNSATLGDECTESTNMCSNKLLYTCIKLPKEDITYWDVTTTCINGCNSDNTACKNNECANDVGHEPNGACICSNECVYGCLEDGSCRCPSVCEGNCSEKGNCNNAPNCTKDDTKCVEGFVYRCIEDEGKNLIWRPTHQCLTGCEENQCKPAKCIEGVEHDVDGSCLCDPDCIYGCMADGSCRHPDFCVKENDKYEADGSCKCLDSCQNGCYPDGSCKSDDYEILVEPNSLQLYSGMIKSLTVQYTKNGITENNITSITAKSMDESCIKVAPNIKIAGFDVEAVSTSSCTTQIMLEDLNRKADNAYVIVNVLEPDANQNHLHDKYETAPNQGNDCRKHSDCDTEPGKGDGFCDSLIGFKCSTKCTSDEQCVQSDEEYAEGKKYNFVCRSDGRCAPDAFVTVWNIEKGDKLDLGTIGIDSVNVDWGDGCENHLVQSDKVKSHEYSNTGVYTISITGTISGWSLYNASNNIAHESVLKLIEIKAFGPVKLGEYAFAFTKNLKIDAIDIPNADILTTLAHAFDNSNYNGNDLNKWDTSNVTDMSYMFYYNTKFNQLIDKWDTSNVTTMHEMFANADAFDKSLATWDTSHVTDMSYMFYYARSFNQPLNAWNVENVSTMESMFNQAPRFNQNLDQWNPINVKTMANLFNNAKDFNGKLGNWKTEKLEDTSYMFLGAIRFNQPINFVTKNVKNMSNMFNMSTNQDVVPAFNNTFGENWDTSKVTDMSYMFYKASAFNQDISNWNTLNVENMDSMFQHATSFNGNIGNWDTSNVTLMANMFYDAQSFNQDLNWNTSKVTDMNSMFHEASTYNGKFGENWDTSKVTNMLTMFLGASNFNQDISNWNTSMVTNMRNIFNGAQKFDQDLSGWEFGQNTDFENMFKDTAMVKVENEAVVKPSSSSDNLCKIYHKIHQSKSDITLNTLLGNSFAEQIQTICSE